jgi:hypothetical protein
MKSFPLCVASASPSSGRATRISLSDDSSFFEVPDNLSDLFQVQETLFLTLREEPCEEDGEILEMRGIVVSNTRDSVLLSCGGLKVSASLSSFPDSARRKVEGAKLSSSLYFSVREEKEDSLLSSTESSLPTLPPPRPEKRRRKKEVDETGSRA